MPQLFVIAGRVKDVTFALTTEKAIIGRDSTCNVRLRDDRPRPKVSRIHAVIVCEDHRYYHKDGDGATRPSLNGTTLNGETIHLPGRRLLKDNDEIGIADYTLVFQDDVPQGDPGEQSTIDVALPVGPDDSSVILAMPIERLESLLKITNRLSHILELDALLSEVVEILLQIFKQADRSFLIVADGPHKSLVPRIFKTRQTESKVTGFSTRIVQESIKTLHGVLSNDPGLGLSSVACAPLWTTKKEPIGALLLDTVGKKLFTQDDVDLLLNVADQVSIALSNAHYHQDALRWEGHKRDLAMARGVVTSFLPERLPEIAGYEFFASYESALEVGGDCYDFVPLAHNQLGVLVGDVSGKGVAAALVMTRFSAETRACLRTSSDLGSAVRQLNQLMQPLGATSRFITLAVAQLDPHSHTVSLVNAGHPRPLLLLHAAGKLVEMDRDECEGPLFGVLDDYQYGAYRFTLEPGDAVFLFSDGVVDAMNVNDERFGVDGVRRVLDGATAAPHELGEKILRAIDQHVAGHRQHDDTTLVCFGRRP